MIKTVLCRLFFHAKKKHILISRGGIVSHNSKLGGYNSFGSFSYFHGSIGLGSYIANDTCLYNTSIGNFTSIGSRVQMTNSRHPTDQFSTSPSFYSINPANGLSFVTRPSYKDIVFVDDERRIAINIGNDVWIGDNALLIGPLRIGDGAIIAAGAVVNRDVEPYSIVGGVPAKLIRKRFDEETIRQFESLCWWNKEFSWIQHNLDSLKGIAKNE